MSDIYDLELMLRSSVPIIVVETHEEARILKLFTKLAIGLFRPLFKWSITEGLQRLDIDYPSQSHNSDPGTVISHIKSTTTKSGIYLLLDFHPYLDDPILIRKLREVALAQEEMGSTVVLISHTVDIPQEIRKQCARFKLDLPGKKDLTKMVTNMARKWAANNPGRKVRANKRTLDLLVNNLSGLTMTDAIRLAKNAIYDDGAITEEDLPNIMEAKYKLFGDNGVLTYEKDTAKFSDVAGLTHLKKWLQQRSKAFHSTSDTKNLDKPKGIMLLGVQGCGKSLAARSVAGVWGIPLLRLDFGALYNKFIGETEKNLREALKTANTMAPCVLWIDEIEKGVSREENDSGVSRRILGTLLTWMSDENNGVFIVATANDITALPPELIRKGRLDEIFFVDLPDTDTRIEILKVHLVKRNLDYKKYNIKKLAQVSAGFSGSELEQAIVSSLYSAHADDSDLTTEHIYNELKRTRPLSVVMKEKIDELRKWAASRTVLAN
ncbi:MAG: AAA family ATPase [Acidiferrobacterales bacterium]